MIPGNVEVRQAISKHIRHSKKVVVILTPNYKDDDRNIYEFNISALEAVYTCRQMMIVLASADLTSIDMTDEILKYMRGTQALPFSWTQNIKGLL